MATRDGGQRADTSGPGDLGHGARAALRAALTGTIFAMSVLAYLGDHETALGKAVVTVAGTGIVIFLGEVYAGLLSAALASSERLSRTEITVEIGASATAAVPGVLAGLLLLVLSSLGLAVGPSIDAALWLGVVTLALCSILEGHGSHRTVPFKIAMVVVSILLGVVIIVLKAELH
ncbi:hypothetical protein [Actinomycetospora sp. TBRC 11914]|uniref:hypothetical protein n=1 Tax=Actinomycetospora sp. TBRC 11914 TaxID=2729387 RepID=UPI00145DCB16|nr:hypothetical protein [Actinomycetospora sp. TBRC 11914]NMO88292.1 hypothetical protein [Actinomycetospora sp. TBRC 11914]